MAPKRSAPAKTPARGKKTSGDRRPSFEIGFPPLSFLGGVLLTLALGAIGAAYCLGGIPVGLDRVNDRIAEVGTVSKESATTSAETSSVVKTVEHRVGIFDTATAMPTGAVLASTVTPRTASDVGVAGVIDDSFAHNPTYCPGGQLYDPSKPSLAVAVGLVATGTLRCGSRVRVSHDLDDGSVLSLEMEVGDQFPDPPGDNINSITARKFNLSRAAASILKIDGVATIEVTLLASPDK